MRERVRLVNQNMSKLHSYLARYNLIHVAIYATINSYRIKLKKVNKRHQTVAFKGVIVSKQIQALTQSTTQK